MRRRARALALLSGAVLALPAVGQQSPESLLPPGFGAAPPARPAPSPDRPREEPLAPPSAPPAVEVPPEDAAPEAAPEEDDTPEPPPVIHRDLSMTGLDDGYGPDAFGDADGRYLSTLLRRLTTPIASRWAEITLRRALLTRVATPAAIAPEDWIADRVQLLLRLGEVNAARALIQQAGGEGATGRLRAAAIRTALATADPAALCELSDGAETVGSLPIWPYARAMCAALSGDGPGAQGLLARAHAQGADAIDRMLPERVVGVAASGRRRVEVDWTGIDSLSDWRFGLASAVAVPIPDALLASSAPFFQAWWAQAPMLPIASRLAAAPYAAALGPFSNAVLVDLYGRGMDESGDRSGETPWGRLRAAYMADDEAARVTAMRGLWNAGDALDPLHGYAAAIVTARAAARVTPAEGYGKDLPRLIAAMLSAGLDRQAARWAGIVSQAGGRDGTQAWALLAVGADRPVVPVDAAHVKAFGDKAGQDGLQRTRLLVAALAGLDRIASKDADALAKTYAVPLGRASAYGDALDRAAALAQPGTLALLVAVGLQTPQWRGVPPADLYRMLRALKAAGMEGEARMIAAEAVTRA